LAVRTARWRAVHHAPRRDRPRKTVEPKVARLAAMLTTPSSSAWDRLAKLANQQVDEDQIHQ
jgi:hypothetical protein